MSSFCMMIATWDKLLKWNWKHYLIYEVGDHDQITSPFYASMSFVIKLLILYLIAALRM